MPVDAFARSAANRANQNALKSARTRGLSVVGREAANFGAGSTPSQTAGVFGLTMRIRHTNLTGKRLASVAPVYAHYGPVGATEGAQSQDWQIKAAIEPTPGDQTKRSEVTYNAQSIIPLARRAIAICDEFPLNLAPGANFYERVSPTTVGANGFIGRHQIALGGTSGFGLDTGEGGSAADVVMGTTAISENSISGFSSSLMLGRTIDGTVTRSLALTGDSTGVGTDDQTFGTNAGGWPSRSASGWAGGNFCFAGETLSQFTDTNNSRTRDKLIWWHTDVLDGYLINDVIQSRTVPQMQADILATAFRFMSRTQNYIKATCLPLTNSTNGWFDVAGQTVRANEANRLAINTWLRDTSASGFVAQANAAVAGIPNAGAARVIDPCAFYEVNSSNVLTLNGGFIRASVTGVLFSGNVASATATSVTASGASFTVNGLRGNVIHIVSGTGAGQVRSIQTNTATVITTGLSWTTNPDATSTYRIYDGNTTDGTHPSTGGHTRIAAGVKPLLDAMMVL